MHDKIYNEVEELFKLYHTSEAKILLEEITKENLYPGRIKYLKGLELYLSGDLASSIELLTEAEKLDSSHQTTELLEMAKKLERLGNQAKSAMDNQNYPEAIELLTKAIAVDEMNFIINQASYFMRALAFYNSGHEEKSIKDYQSFERLKSLRESFDQDLKTENV